MNIEDLKAPKYNTPIKYIGSQSNSPINPYIGQMYYSTIINNLLLYNGTGWSLIGTNIGTDIKENLHKTLMTHCKACGAALHGYKCDYCGVEYY